MGILSGRNKQSISGDTSSSSNVDTKNTESTPQPPRLARRSLQRHSHIKSGRTIGAKRERLETAHERAIARQKTKRRNYLRIISVTIIFVFLIGVLVALSRIFFGPHSADTNQKIDIATSDQQPLPTIEIIDEVTSNQPTSITDRMRGYIGLVEADLRDLGLTPARAVLPAGSIREVDLYLDGMTGFIKFTIDRDSAVSAEDAERLLRYLSSIGVTEFTYIDVRLPGKAYWK